MSYVCPCCGSFDASIRDNERFSSLKCRERIRIYFYGNRADADITLDEKIAYDERKRKAVKGRRGDADAEGKEEGLRQRGDKGG